MFPFARAFEKTKSSGILLFVLFPSFLILVNASQGSATYDITSETFIHPTADVAEGSHEGLPYLFDTGQNQAHFPVPAILEPFIFPPQNGNSSSEDVPGQKACSASKPLVMCYYPDWAVGAFPPEKIDFKLFDWIDFAFAVPDTKFSLAWDDPSAPGVLKRLVSAAHARNTKVKLSIGGWTGSQHFSSAVSSVESRKTFVNNILEVFHGFNLDGIDIDWEYPGRDGAPGNQISPNDSDNFLLFLNLLRAELPPSARISAAVESTPFIDNHGNAMKDVSGFAQVLDWVLIMNYDVWESSSKPGPNAPLQDFCKNSTQPKASAVAAYKAWTSAKFPACKLVLGLPSYGYISKSTAQRLRTRSKSKKAVKVVNDDGGTEGQVQFRGLVKQGALVRTVSTSPDGITTISFRGGGGFERRWDSCSATPFLRSNSSKQIITYDDLESLGMKAEFAWKVGMLGVNIFDVHGDTDYWDLTSCIRNRMGLA